MKTLLNPYIAFKDNARQAMEFYHSVFGGKLDINTFGDSHASPDPSYDDKIMHARLEADNGIVFMAADTPPGMEYKGICGMSVSLSGDNKEELEAYFSKLAEGGTVMQPLVKADWGDSFGMLSDKFGVTWLVNISDKK
ncbi:MAG TPA: VOC family protein [Bacillota bacterium]|nr:VOC family protein [Bacillota bacterium]